MESNLGESFQKLMDHSFPRYKGKVIERLPEGFMVFSRKFNTWEEVTKAVDESGKIWNANIIKQNK